MCFLYDGVFSQFQFVFVCFFLALLLASTRFEFAVEEGRLSGRLQGRYSSKCTRIRLQLQKPSYSFVLLWAGALSETKWVCKSQIMALGNLKKHLLNIKTTSLQGRRLWKLATWPITHRVFLNKSYNLCGPWFFISKVIQTL